MASDLIKTGQDLGLSKKQWDLIGAITPPGKIKKRPGRGGQTFDYVETGYIVELLNTTFNGLWDFKVIEEKVGESQVWVRGELTAYLSPEIKITKSQYGGSDIKKTKEGVIIDIADDLKAASSDCLKKCASLFGFAKDIYWQEKGKTETSEKRNYTPSSSGMFKASPKQVNLINVLCAKKGQDREEVKKKFGVSSMNDLTYNQVQEVIKYLDQFPDVEEDIPIPAGEF